jgi:hypothetical protein
LVGTPKVTGFQGKTLADGVPWFVPLSPVPFVDIVQPL